jgi:hypothetical protein
MWYRTAIDLGNLFGSKQEEENPEFIKKPDVPEDVFREHVRSNTPQPPLQIETGLGDQHLILTGAGEIHQGVSHSMFLDRILDAARKSISGNPDLREKYNTSRFPEYAYGPDDLLQRRNERLSPGQEKMHPEDAVTEILHDYFDQGIRISNMAGYMAINAIHLPSLMQINKIFDIIHLLQPKEVAIKIVTDKGTFMEMYDINNIADIKQDILQFKIHGPKKQSTMSEWRRY